MSNYDILHVITHSRSILKKSVTLAFFMLPIGLLISPTWAQGIFDSTNDWPQIGDFFVPGEVQVTGEGEEAVYTLTGNGNGLGETNDSDEGFFLYTEKEDSWSLQGRLTWDNPGLPESGSVGLTIREDGENPSARHYTAVMRVVDGEERSDVRYRNILALSGLPTNELRTLDDEPLVDPGEGLWFRLSHIHPLFLFLTEYSLDGEVWILADTQVFPWATGSLAYGLFIASDSDDEEVVQAQVDNVSLIPSPPVADRSFSKPVFSPNDTINVTLDVYTSTQTPELVIEETIPQGWTAANISHGGQSTDGTITWSLTDVSAGRTTLTYQAVVPDDPASSAEWEGTIVDGLEILGKSGLMLSGGDVSRISDGILMFYDFSEGEGDTVFDQSGVGDPVDLTIEDPEKVVWSPGSLRVAASTKIRSFEPVPKLFDTFTDFDHDGSITIEAWVAPGNTEQTGPARMVTYSDNPSYRNFTLGQQADFYQMRLRTGLEVTDANRNGTQPFFSSPEGTATTTLTHVVFVRDADWSTFLFINGEDVSEEGSFYDFYFDNWDPSYEFGLANEINEERPWLGEYYLVAIYDRGLTADEVAQNFAAGVEIPDVHISTWPIY